MQMMLTAPASRLTALNGQLDHSSRPGSSVPQGYKSSDQKNGINHRLSELQSLQNYASMLDNTRVSQMGQLLRMLNFSTVWQISFSVHGTEKKLRLLCGVFRAIFADISGNTQQSTYAEAYIPALFTTDDRSNISSPHDQIVTTENPRSSGHRSDSPLTLFNLIYILTKFLTVKFITNTILR